MASSRSRSTPAPISPTFAPRWHVNSKLFTSAFCCVTQFRLVLNTLQSSFFRQISSSFIVSRAIHQERVVFFVSPFPRGSFVICCATLRRCLKSYLKQHTVSSSGTHTSFCPRTSFCHMSSDLSMQLQPSTTPILTDPPDELINCLGERVRHQRLGR